MNATSIDREKVGGALMSVGGSAGVTVFALGAASVVALGAATPVLPIVGIIAGVALTLFGALKFAHARKWEQVIAPLPEEQVEPIVVEKHVPPPEALELPAPPPIAPKAHPIFHTPVPFEEEVREKRREEKRWLGRLFPLYHNLATYAGGRLGDAWARLREESMKVFKVNWKS